MRSTSRFSFWHWKQEKDWRWERKHDCKIFFLLKTLMGNRGSCQFAPLWSFRVESISRKLTARNSDCPKILQCFLQKKDENFFFDHLKWIQNQLYYPLAKEIYKTFKQTSQKWLRGKCEFFVLMFYTSKIVLYFDNEKNHRYGKLRSSPLKIQLDHNDARVKKRRHFYKITIGQTITLCVVKSATKTVTVSLDTEIYFQVVQFQRVEAQITNSWL